MRGGCVFGITLFLLSVLGFERINELSDMEREVYQILREEPTIRQIDLANRLDLTEQYIRKLIKKLKEHGWIERIGAKKNGYWKIIEKP